ncbi:MAG: YeeE/YedE family protein [Bacteroidales bacterium]|nr:YeeE/YedE family protein [Bacteroidales bacterium]
MDTQKNNQIPHYINPYLGGVLLGMLLLLTIYITGRGLGASGAVKSTVATTAQIVTPQDAKDNAYIGRFITNDHSPMYTWLVFESIGIFLGGLLSGVIFRRVRKPRVEHSSKISANKRMIYATIGGILFGIGSQFGRGCTSGAALSGSGTFAVGGIIVMFAIFGTGYAIAWAFKKLWI